MSDTPGAAPVSDDDPGFDENDPGEVGTSFTTKGQGWSGRDKDEDRDE